MQIKILARDILLVCTTVVLCLVTAYAIRYYLDYQARSEQTDQLLRRLDKDKRAKEKMRELPEECPTCRRA